MANIIGGVTNKYNQLFANEYYTNLTRQEYVIRQAPDGTFEIRRTSPSAFDFRIGDAGYFIWLTYHQGWRIINAPMGVSWNASVADTPYLRLGSRYWDTIYFDILIRTGKVTLKNQQSWPLEINSPADVVINAGANILAQIAGSNIMQITSQGIKTTSQIEDITTTFVDGSVVDADKNVFVGGIIILNTALGPASCQVEVSPDGVTWYVIWRANMPPGLGDISQSFMVYIPAGWRMQRVGANFTKSNLFKIRL
jgi:hypothetical protein